MGFFKKWVQSSSPTVKVLMGISISSILFVGNKLFYAPYDRKNKALKAEAWANMIIEQEEAAMKESSENQ